MMLLLGKRKIDANILRSTRLLGKFLILLACTKVILFSSASYAIMSPYASNETEKPKEENESPIIKSQIRFWQTIFLKYDQSKVLVHDLDYPDIIVDIIDLKKMAKRHKIVGNIDAPVQKKISAKHLEHYKKAIEKYRKYGKQAVNMGPFERRLYMIYGRDAHQLKKLLLGKIQLRTQIGLLDSVKLAAKRAANYLETMENIFEEEKMPKILTRIAFVESMFDVKARSKVGAFGIWQFMAQTGKRFLTIKNFIDERGSPFKATRAAARLLKENYLKLGSWPLAITAYNHGVNGIRRAKSSVGSDDLEDIISKYQSKSFGFASKNFYSEFVAVAKVYEYLRHQKEVPEVDRDLEIVPVRLTKAMPIKTLIKAAAVSIPVLMRYNGCINEKVLHRNKNLILPQNYVLYFPRRLAVMLMKQIAALEGPRYAYNKN